MPSIVSASLEPLKWSNWVGYLITTMGVKTGLAKVKAIQDWSVPKSLKQLKGFLRFFGYYKYFIKGYGVLAKPLIDLLKKHAFV